MTLLFYTRYIDHGYPGKTHKVYEVFSLSLTIKNISVSTSLLTCALSVFSPIIERIKNKSAE